MSVRNKFEIIHKASMSTAAHPDTLQRTNTPPPQRGNIVPQDEFYEANVTQKNTGLNSTRRSIATRAPMGQIPARADWPFHHDFRVLQSSPLLCVRRRPPQLFEVR